MKKIMNKIAFIAIIISLLSISCQKDTDFESIETNDAIKVVSYPNPFGKASDNEILVFRDMAVFRNQIEKLENDVIQHDDDFIAKYNNLNEDEINAKDEEIGFDENKPLKDFENSLNFNSLLNDYLAKQDEWLQTDDLDEELAPEKFFYGLDEEELTLLNRDRAVKIGQFIYVQMNGGIVTIKDGNFSTLSRVANYNNINDINADDFDNIDIDNKTNSTEPNCLSDWYEKRQNWSTSSRKRMRGIIRIQDDPLWGQKLKVKTLSYKKGWTGRWRKWRTKIKAALDGHSGEKNIDNCGEYSRTYYETVHYEYHSNKSKAKYKDSNYNNSPLVLKGELKGVHTTQGTYKRDLVY